LFKIVEEELGLAIVSASENEQALQNLDGIYRQFLRTVLAFVAAMEREFIRQRVKAAMARLKSEGKINNIAEREPQLAEEAAKLYRGGASLGEIARALKVSTWSVRRLLAEKGLYSPPPGICPRCFSKMKVVEKTAKVVDGKYVVETKYYCRKCGYEEKGSVRLDVGSSSAAA
jgi:DNA invertase Pin-like site-specific DNA recombinase